MKVYEAKIYFEDGTETGFQFTKYSFDKQMFKFEEQIRNIERIFFIKDIKHIKIHYVGELGD